MADYFFPARLMQGREKIQRTNYYENLQFLLQSTEEKNGKLYFTTDKLGRVSHPLLNKLQPTFPVKLGIKGEHEHHSGAGGSFSTAFLIGRLLRN